MREPKFSDAPCFGKEFDARSKVCGVCLGSKPCQRNYLAALAAPNPRIAAVPAPDSLARLRLSSRLSRQFIRPL
jgi:hypothetical protein